MADLLILKSASIDELYHCDVAIDVIVSAALYVKLLSMVEVK